MYLWAEGIKSAAGWKEGAFRSYIRGVKVSSGASEAKDAEGFIWERVIAQVLGTGWGGVYWSVLTATGHVRAEVLTGFVRREVICVICGCKILYMYIRRGGRYGIKVQVLWGEWVYRGLRL
jgi:hypothetical protein